MNSQLLGQPQQPGTLPNLWNAQGDPFQSPRTPKNANRVYQANQILGISGADMSLFTTMHSDVRENPKTTVNWSNAAWIIFEQPESIDVVSAGWVPALQKDYALIDEESDYEEALQQTPSLYALLREAVAPLKAAFPNEAFFQLEVLKDDDFMLRVIVRLPAGTVNAAEMMRSFKQNWWFKNCHRSEASLVFDYETGDGL